MGLLMLDDKVAVIPIEDPEKVGHIIIPDTAKRRVDQGIVKYRGDNVKEVRVGDHVCFSGYTGTKITVKDEGTLFIMREEDIIALMGEGEPMFTRNQIEHRISAAQNDFLMREGEDTLVRKFVEILQAYFEADFERGLEF